MSNDTTSRDVKNQINPTDYYTSRLEDFKPNRPGWQNVRCVFHGDNTPSLAVNSETGGYICFGCGAKGGDIISFEQAFNHCTFPEAIESLKQFAGMPDYQRMIPEPRRAPRRENELAKLKQMWEHAGPLTAENPQAEVARKYLVYRGLVNILDDLPNDLRTRYLQYWHKGELDEKAKLKGTYAALIAVVRDAKGYPCCCHRTYLSDTGEGKAYVSAPKKLTARLRDPRGAAIKLYQPTEELAIAEGIETALSVRVATGLPVWAAVSTGLMVSVAVPESVKRVWVMADNDENGAGESAAVKLVSRLLKEGKDARLVMPDKFGDWNDVLLGVQANG
jgi:putative DNA primase/helicase